MKTFRYFSVLFFFVFLSSHLLQAQPFSLDTTFKPTYTFRDFYFEDRGAGITRVYEMDDGSLRLGGGFQDPFDNTMIGEMIKLDQNGTFDPTFGFGGGGVSIGLHYKNPYLYVNGTLSCLLRLDSENCERDTVFDNNRISSCWGSAAIDNVHLVPEEDFFFVSGGIYYHCDSSEIIASYIARIHEDGTYDTTFHHDANYVVRNFHRYDSTRTMLSGTFTAYDGVPRYRLVRIYNDGSLDTSFHSIIQINSSSKIDVIKTLDDGKMLVGGEFSITGYDKQLALVRLMPNGDLDSTFNNFNNAQSTIGLLHPDSASYDLSYGIWTLAETQNNKLLIGGSFWNYQGHYRGSLALTDENGFIDTSVFTGLGVDSCLGLFPYYFNHGVICITPSQTGKYYVAGRFTRFNGQDVQPIIRLNPHDHVGIEEQQKKKGLLVYPNPVKETLSISAGFMIEEVEIYNLSGSRVLKHQLNNTRKAIEISNLPQGHYILRATGKNDVWIEKFVVVR